MTEKEQALAYLNRDRVLNISIIEPLRLERGQVLAAGPQGVAVQVEDVTMVAADSYAAAMALVPPDFHTLNVMGGRLAEQVQESLGLTCTCQCYQAAYLETERLQDVTLIEKIPACVVGREPDCFVFGHFCLPHCVISCCPAEPGSACFMLHS